MRAFGKVGKKFSTEKTEKRKVKKERNDYIYGVLFVIFAILLEIVNFVTLGIGVLPTNFGIEFAIILIIAGFIFILPTEWLKVTVTTIFLAFQGIINIINSCVFKNLFNFTTVDMLFARGGETGAVFEFDFINWGCLLASLAVLGVYIAAVVLGSKYMPRIKSKFRFSSVCYMIAVAVVIECCGLVTYNFLDKAYAADADSEYIYENGEYLYGSTDLKFANMKKYGFWAYYLKSIEKFVNYEELLSEEEQQELKVFLEEGKGFKYSDSEYEAEQMSGLLKDDNLLMIMMESIEWFAIDPFNTPNLYDLIYDNSMYFTEYYSRNATNFSEDISILGNVPNEYAFSNILKKVGVETPESLPNYFKNNGYESVNFFHDYLGEFYDRYTLNTAIGFDKVYALSESPMENKPTKFGQFVDDGDYVQSLIEQMLPKDKKFFSFFTTVSTHGPYTESNDRFNIYYRIFDENYTKFCNYNEEHELGYVLPEMGTKNYKILKEYKSKAMALDNAIGIIVDYLENNTGSDGRKLSDSTAIVLFADHNAYYQNLSYKIKNVGKYADEKTAYRVPFSISSSKLKTGENKTFCNTYDIFPTLCDLYGFDFNSSLTHGYSVFSKDIEKSMFLSSLSTIFDENVYSLDMDKYYKDGKQVELDEEVLSFKAKVNTYVLKQIMIEKYYRVNYAKNYA